jgi:hypothetical protein
LNVLSKIDSINVRMRNSFSVSACVACPAKSSGIFDSDGDVRLPEGCHCEPLFSEAISSWQEIASLAQNARSQ